MKIIHIKVLKKTLNQNFQMMGTIKRCILASILIFAFSLYLFAQDNKHLSPRNANYTIDAKLDVQKKTVDGKMVLQWKNISQDSIQDLQFHMYLNAFKNTKSTFMRESIGRFSHILDNATDLSWGYIDIHKFQIKGVDDLTSKIKYIQPDDINIDDQTVIHIPLNDTILPGQEIIIECDFTSKLPELFARTGYYKDYYFVGQWFPKIGVYESKGTRNAKESGWNCHQFHATSEFYADFGNYNINITVPKEYIVGATGQQINETTSGNEKTINYKAEDVIDFAWSASPTFIEIKDNYEGIDIKLLLQPELKKDAQRFIEPVKNAIKYSKDHIGEYPYPNITIINTPYDVRDFTKIGVGGMEYPMLITVRTMAWIPRGINITEKITIHEFLHQYFMGVLATNEFEEAWMDEGMTSYMHARIMDLTYGKSTSVSDFAGIRIGNAEKHRFDYISSPNKDLVTSYGNTWDYSISSYGLRIYRKPSTFLTTLHRLVGDKCMDDIIKTYYKKWKFKHPCSNDFIDVVNEVVIKHHKDAFGENMNWYFDQVLYSSSICDYKVVSIRNAKIIKPQGVFDIDGTKVSGDKLPSDSAKIYESTVVVKREGDIIMPIEVLIQFADGQEITKKWNGKERIQTFKFYTNVKLASAQIDPENKILIDANLANNSKKIKPAKNPVLKYTAKLLFWIQNIIQSSVWFV